LDLICQVPRLGLCLLPQKSLGRSGQSEATPMKIHIPGRSRVSPVGNSGGSGLVSSPSGLAGRPRQPGMNREASVSPFGHLSRAAWISAAAAEVAMVMDRCKRRRNRLKSALGRRRVSQSEDLLRCRFSLSRTIRPARFLSRTILSRTIPRTIPARSGARDAQGRAAPRHGTRIAAVSIRPVISVDSATLGRIHPDLVCAFLCKFSGFSTASP